MDSRVVENSLYYGYFPACAEKGIPEFIRQSVTSEQITGSDDELIDQGITALRDSFRALAEDIPQDSEHILPLSGGLDSRLVLGLLIDFFEADSIHTVTVGRPVAMDYEIGQQVAATAGVSNTALDPSADSFEWDLEDLVDYAGSHEYPNRILGGYIQWRARTKLEESIDNDVALWSGFLGDPLAGSHLSYYDGTNGDWEAAREVFADENSITHYDLTPVDYDAVTILPDEPWLPPDELSYGEQLDFAIRQQCWIKQNVGPHAISPFATSRWSGFILNVPQRYRENQSLYKKICLEMYPDLFSLPSEHTDGAPLSAGKFRQKASFYQRVARMGYHRVRGHRVLPPRFQWMNFAEGFRRESSFKEMVEELIAGLSNRGVIAWVDPLEIWNRHQDGEEMHLELRVLASLEAFLRSRES